MIRLIWLFLVAAGLAAAAAFLAGQEGGVTIVWGTREIAMPPGVFVALLLAAVAALLILWRVFGFLIDWPGAVSRWRREKRRRAGYLALARGMVAVAAGDAQEARRHQAKAKLTADEPLLSQLLSAQTAQLEGDEEATAHAYADMLGRPETEFLGLRGLFMQAMRRGDADAARRYAGRAFALRPKTPWVANALFDREAQAGDWAAAARALDGQARAKLIEADVAKRRRAVLAAAEAQDLAARGEPIRALEKAREALKAAPGLMSASLAAAAGWKAQGRTKRAAAVLERAWTSAPHPEIAAAYGALAADPAARRFDRLIGHNPAHPESKLLSAAASAGRGQLQEAEAILAPLLTPDPALRAAQLMADIATQRGDTANARLWADRALRAPRDDAWRCGACEHEAAGWGATCGHCGAFDTLIWGRPAATPRLLEDDPVRKLYRLAPPARPAGAPSVAEPATRPEPVTIEVIDGKASGGDMGDRP